jgi:hypothetical protein
MKCGKPGCDCEIECPPGRNAEGGPTANKAIGGFVHCVMCLREIEQGRANRQSPESYARLNVGYTEIGWQVWCVRHNVNVMHIDFEGHVHPANAAPREPREPRAS